MERSVYLRPRVLVREIREHDSVGSTEEVIDGHACGKRQRHAGSHSKHGPTGNHRRTISARFGRQSYAKADENQTRYALKTSLDP
jgi:hypothetical protein